MMLTASEIFSLRHEIDNQNQYKMTPVMGLFPVTMQGITLITKLSRSEFLARFRTRTKVVDGKTYSIPPVFIPLDKRSEPERGRNKSWTLSFMDLFLLKLLSETRDYKSGFQKALGNFIDYHCLQHTDIAEKNIFHESYDYSDFFELEITSQVVNISRKPSLPNRKKEHPYLDKGKIAFRNAYQLTLLKAGKPISAWVYLTHDDNFHYPTINTIKMKNNELIKLIEEIDWMKSPIRMTINLTEQHKELKKNINTHL